MATPRKNLFTYQAYFEMLSGTYFWTPDCVGVYWFDSADECLAETESDFVITVQELED